MASKEKREKWIRLGLCSHCGKEPPAEGKKMCQRCLDTAKQNRDYKRSRHICVKCGRNKAAPNCKYCDERLEQRRQKYEKESKSKDYLVREKSYRDAHMQKCKENGLCVWCMKPVFENRSFCYEHLISRRNYMRCRRVFEKAYKED